MMRRTALILLILPSLALAQPAEPAPDAPRQPIGSDILPPLSLDDAQWLSHRAQLILSRVSRIRFHSVDKLPESSRQAGGFGSTGIESSPDPDDRKR